MMATEGMTGADVLLKVFEEEDVQVIFGIPGGVTIPIFDKLYHKVSTTRSRPARFGSSSRATSKVRRMLPTAMRGPPVGSECVPRPAGRGH